MVNKQKQSWKHNTQQAAVLDDVYQGTRRSLACMALICVPICMAGLPTFSNALTD